MIKDIAEQEQQFLVGGHDLQAPPGLSKGKGGGAKFTLPSVINIQNSASGKTDMPQVAAESSPVLS